MNEVPSQRGELLDTAYTSIFLPRLRKPDLLGLVEAQSLMNSFNARSGTDLHVRDLFSCTVTTVNNQLIPMADMGIILDAARLTVEDCNAALLNPKNTSVREVIRTKKLIAQRVIKAWS